MEIKEEMQREGKEGSKEGKLKQEEMKMNGVEVNEECVKESRPGFDASRSSLGCKVRRASGAEMQHAGARRAIIRISVLCERHILSFSETRLRNAIIECWEKKNGQKRKWSEVVAKWHSCRFAFTFVNVCT